LSGTQDMSGSLKLAFMGSPDFAVPVLAALVSAGHDVVCVYAQPPRRAGRGKKLRATPVQAWAEAHGLPVRTPAGLRSAVDQKAFVDLGLDAAVVVAYGLILPGAILEAPRLGCLNMHASLLPRWRGAAPIHRAIMAGDKETGVQAMVMEKGLDTGPVLATEKVSIAPDETTGSLHDKLASLAGPLAVRALQDWAGGTAVPVAQADDGMTYADKITAQDQRIDWSWSARRVDHHIRGLSPAPGAWFHYKGSEQDPGLRIKALNSELVEFDETALAARVPGAEDQNRRICPGMVVDDHLTISCGDGGLVRITELQRPGARPMPAGSALRGLSLPKGTILE
jgi:methionyl-tRNA formyltransferase